MKGCNFSSPYLISVVLFKSCLTGHNIIETVSLASSSSSSLPPPSLLPSRAGAARLLLYISDWKLTFYSVDEAGEPYSALASPHPAWLTSPGRSGGSKGSNRAGRCLSRQFRLYRFRNVLLSCSQAGPPGGFSTLSKHSNISANLWKYLISYTELER